MEQQERPEISGPLGKLSPGEKKLDGKTFYIDRVKKRSMALLLEVITLFGGKVESFLHKEVNFVVTGCLEEPVEREKSPKTISANEETTSSKRQEGGLNDRQRRGAPRTLGATCGSRGKALLEKAILNKERLQGASVLTNARLWGVKILYADDVLCYLKHLSFDTKSKKSEKLHNKQSSNVVKAASLRSPYLKIEDSSRKYKPLHMQSMNFPSLYYSGRYCPFEAPPPPRFDKWTEPEEKKNKENKVAISTDDQCQTPLSCNPSPWKQHKKQAYCECCCQTYSSREEHLLSDQHRAFALEASNYSGVDQIVAALVPGFNPDPPSPPEDLIQETLTIPDACELEPLTDVEMEDAVEELQTHQSNLELSAFFENPQVGDFLSITNPNAPIAALPLSPVMPVLEIIPQDSPLLEPHRDFKPLSPCPVDDCQYPDPFPPVLSPQITDLVTHSSYSEAPILSPQLCTAQDLNDELAVQMENVFCASQCVPVDPHHSGTDAITVVKLPMKNQAEMKVCYNSWERRSCSVPRQSTTALNSKKRSRSASPEGKLSKRRRIAEMGGLIEKHDQQLAISKDSDALFFEMTSCESFQTPPIPFKTLSSCKMNLNLTQTLGTFSVPPASMAVPWYPLIKPPLTNIPLPVFDSESQTAHLCQQPELSNPHSTSVSIESALIPDVATLTSSSDDSDWDCELLSRLTLPPKTATTAKEHTGELDQDLLQQPCPWTHDSSYESRLHSVLQSPAQTLTADPSAFSRTVVPIVEVQH